MTTIEMLGYLGSVLVAISLMMSNIKRLRWVNLSGAVVFTLYGLIIQAYPIAVVNAIIIAVDSYYLVQLSHGKELFSLHHVDTANSFLLKFLEYYSDDLSGYVPEFDLNKIRNPHAVFILRDMIPVGLFIYEYGEDKCITIHLDYVIPNYRDLKSTAYLLDQLRDQFLRDGYQQLVTKTNSPTHQRYLKKMGFQPHSPDSDTFFRPV